MDLLPKLRLLLSMLMLVTTATCLNNAAFAQGIESVLAPGKLIQGHAKAEADCKNCHLKFDRASQDALCTNCHKDIGADVREHRGFHGRQKPQACRTCHEDHKGRDARIVVLDPRRFDHRQTDYLLAGKHVSVDCKACHVVGRKWREAPADCAICHKNSDVHKGALGSQCTDCHNESGWKKTTFDHAKTRFDLTDKHAEVKCSACHEDQRYKDTPRNCFACHRKDDSDLIKGRRGHQGQFGEKCETCHNARGWKPSVFNHDVDTKYALNGKHRHAECKACHTGPLYKEKLATDCQSCHQKDDKHKGSLGRNCASCHNERGWNDQGKFDHDKTKFPLLGKHVEVKCESCHKSLIFKDAPSDCVACHLKDDKHDGALGKACYECHVASDWKTTKGRFDHNKTLFPLRNAHAATSVQCKDCHASLKSMRGTSTECISCHLKDDEHAGQEGRSCAQCHDDKHWKPAPRFDHGLVRFPLLGKHVAVECKICHKDALFKNAKSACYACHVKDDKHKKTLSVACDKCHNASSWKAWDFDHDKRTKFALDGKHKGLACSQCHVRPVEAKVTTSSQCVSCHAKDDTHDGGYGRQCQQCHVTSSFREIKARPGHAMRDAEVKGITPHAVFAWANNPSSKVLQ